MSNEDDAAANRGFAFDTALAIAQLRTADATLAKLIDRVGPFVMELKRTPSVFDALGEAIVYQQLHARAAASIHARVRALIPRMRGIAAARALADVSDDALRGAGFRARSCWLSATSPRRRSTATCRRSRRRGAWTTKR